MSATVEEHTSDVGTLSLKDDKSQNEIVSNAEFLRLKKQGNELFGEEKIQEALGKYEEAEKYAETDEELAALLHNKGFAYERLNEFDKAIEAYTQAIAKRQDYGKVFCRRAKLYKVLGRFGKSLDDFVEMTVIEMKENKVPDAAGSPFLSELLISYTEHEVRKIIEERESFNPPKYIIEGFLRPFYKDPVSRLWKGLDKSPVDDLIAQGKADDLTGYLAAVRDLKLKKYETIVQLCTDEISNKPESEYILDALFLRSTLNLIWGKLSETEADIRKVIEHPSASNELKSSAYLKLALRHVTRHPMDITVLAEDFEKAEQLCLENPDVYFHGALTLVDRAHPVQALEMLLHGMKMCGDNSPSLLKALYYTIKFSVEQDESQQKEAFATLRDLESSFDSPDCHEMYAQALLFAGEDYNVKLMEQMDKAISYDKTDPTFRIKKIIMSRWGGDVDVCIQKLKEFVEVEPNAFAYYHIGHGEIMRGNLVEGIAAMQKSIDLSSCLHELELRVASKLELQYHLSVNQKLKDAGLDSLSQDFEDLALKSFP